MKRFILQIFCIPAFLPVLVLFILNPFSAQSQISCALPAPTGLSITSTTASTISASWDATVSAASYRVSTYDLTNGLYLPDIYTSANSCIINGVQTDQNLYQISVSASSCVDGPYGPPSNANSSLFIIIIVDQIVQKGCSSSDAFQAPANGNILVSMPANNSQGDLITAQHIKVTYDFSFVEFLLWADCYGHIRFYEVETSKVIRVPYFSGPVPFILYKTVSPTLGFLSIADGSCSAGTGCQVMLRMKSDCKVEMGTCTLVNDINTCGEYSGNGARISSDEHFPLSQHAISTDLFSSKSNTTIQTKLTTSPNPFSDHFTVRFFAGSKNTVSLTLLDATGHFIRTLDEMTTPTEGPNESMFQLDDLPDGVYLLLLQTSEKREITKLVKVTR